MHKNRLLNLLLGVLAVVCGCLILGQGAQAQAPQTLRGTFVLRQSDIQGECNASRFSDAPETGGEFTLVLDANAGTASGSLQGGGSGSRGISCPEQNPVPAAQMDWSQDYRAEFDGSFDAATGEIVLDGTLDGSNDIRWRDCTNGAQVVACQGDFGLNNLAQSYSFPVTLNGNYEQVTNSASGTWTVAPIIRPTSGEWTVRGTQSAATSIPPPSPTVPRLTVAPQPSTSTGPIGGDEFTRPDTDDPCALGSSSSGGRQLFYLPIFPSAGSNPEPLGALIVDGALQNNGLDFGGFQFAHEDACAEPRGFVRGADMGQDLNFAADLVVPTNAAGLITQAGPYFRSRAAAYADGIIGGESAGYWVQLYSTGEIKIKQLNPFAEIAASCKPLSFDAGVPHRLEIAAGGSQLQIALDEKLQTFNQNGQVTTEIDIAPTIGSNDGTAGIAFGAETNRGQLGGQRADNISIGAYRLLDLPVQDNCLDANVTSPTAPASTATITGQATPTVPLNGGGITVNGVDTDPDNHLWNCDTNRVPFGESSIDRSRCITFRYTPPPGGIKSALLHFAVDPIEPSTDVVSIGIATMHPTCTWTASPVACVSVEYPITLDLEAVDINLLFFNPADARVQVANELNRGVLHVLFQDDTTVFCAQLALNGGDGRPLCTAQNPGTVTGSGTRATAGNTTPTLSNAGGTGTPSASTAGGASGSSTPNGVTTRVAVTTATSTAGQTTSSSPGTGDCDNDGKLSELDALCALQISVQLTELNPAMDVDGNGFVDSRDAVVILQRAVGR